MTGSLMDPGEFAERFAASEPETRRAFVADLWDALGWTTSIEGAEVVVERAGPPPETRRLLVPTGESLPAEPAADALVVPGDTEADAPDAPDRSHPADADVPVIDAADIRERALYGADRSATAGVFRRHFDRELATGSPGDGPDPAPSSDGDTDAPTDAEAETAPEAEDAPESADEPGVDGTCGTDGTPEDDGDTTGPDLATAGAAGAFLLAMLVIGGVGFAAGAGMLSPGLALGENPVANATDTGTTGSTDGAGTASRYASMWPTCERPPELVIKIQVDAFGHNEELGGNTGIRTAYRFAAPENREATGPQASFARLIEQRYAILLRHESVQYGPIRPERGDRAVDGSRTLTQRVTLTDANGTEKAYLWSVTEQDGEEYGGCWMTTSVVPVREDD
jgi:hypothetical protein